MRILVTAVIVCLFAFADPTAAATYTYTKQYFGTPTTFTSTSTRCTGVGCELVTPRFGNGSTIFATAMKYGSDPARQLFPEGLHATARLASVTSSFVPSLKLNVTGWLGHVIDNVPEPLEPFTCAPVMNRNPLSLH